MVLDYEQLLKNEVVIAAMSAAWVDSRPGVSGGHEEGGFVLRNADRKIEVLRWVTGCRIASRYHPILAAKLAKVIF